MKIELSEHEAKSLADITSREAVSKFREVFARPVATLADLDRVNFWAALSCRLAGVEFTPYRREDFAGMKFATDEPVERLPR